MDVSPAPDLFAPGAVSEARIEELFCAEPIWLLRVARLTAECGRPPVAPVTVLARRAAQATPLGAEARVELEAMLLGPHPDIALQWLHDAGLLARLLPELEATVDFTQEAERKHKDVWMHTKQVVRQSAARPAVRWAALLHDVGKVPTRTFTPEGKVHFHRHAEVGARMFDAVGRRLSFERPMRQKIRFLVLHHLRANQYARGWTDSAVRRFDRETGEHLVDLLDLSRADITSKRDERRREAWRNTDDLQARILALREEDARQPPLPAGIGDAMMARYAQPAGRWIGDLKRAMEAAIEAGELEARRDAEYYLAWLEAKSLAPRE
ncbi:MAG: HD domain-containing protein [Myxococcota bacterium]